jgi:hypothetical protein
MKFAGFKESGAQPLLPGRQAAAQAQGSTASEALVRRRACQKDNHDPPDRSCRKCYLDNARIGVVWGIFCVHGRQASRCHEGDCKGTGVCEHSVLLIQCAQCSEGKQKCLCEHNVRAKRCLDCWRKAKKNHTPRPSGLCKDHGKTYCPTCVFPKHAFAESSDDEGDE